MTLTLAFFNKLGNDYSNFSKECCCFSVIRSCPLLRSHGLQHASLPCPLPSPRVCSNSCPLSQWSHPPISSSTVPFFCPKYFPASESFPMSWLFTSGGQSVGAFIFSINPSDEYSGLILIRIDWFDLLACPRDSQESSLAPQFGSINSSVFSLLCGPTLPSIHDYWKNHSFDYIDLCWQSDISAFQYTV